MLHIHVIHYIWLWHGGNGCNQRQDFSSICHVFTRTVLNSYFYKPLTIPHRHSLTYDCKLCIYENICVCSTIIVYCLPLTILILWKFLCQTYIHKHSLLFVHYFSNSFQIFFARIDISLVYSGWCRQKSRLS